MSPEIDLQERLHAFGGIENLPKGKDAYKRRFEAYGCFNPECQNGCDLETHHIVPKSKGGKDEFENYILLCQDCHRHLNNHSQYRERMVILWTYKFFFESKLRGENELPELQATNRESPGFQGEDRPEILQHEMPNELSQQAENPKTYKELPRRIERPFKEVPVIKMRKCWWCGIEFDGLIRRSWCCSDLCKEHFKKDPENSFYHRGAKILSTGRLIKWTILGLIKTLKGELTTEEWRILSHENMICWSVLENNETINRLTEHLEEALTALRKLEGSPLDTPKTS